MNFTLPFVMTVLTLILIAWPLLVHLLIKWIKHHDDENNEGLVVLGFITVVFFCLTGVAYAVFYFSLIGHTIKALA